MSFPTMIRKPSAFLPLVISFIALALVLVHVAVFGGAREADEGTSAHIFQLLMMAQAPIIVFFAIKWLPRFPKQALQVLVLQACAAFATFAPVFFLNL